MQPFASGVLPSAPLEQTVLDSFQCYIDILANIQKCNQTLSSEFTEINFFGTYVAYVLNIMHNPLSSSFQLIQWKCEELLFFIGHTKKKR